MKQEKLSYLLRPNLISPERRVVLQAIARPILMNWEMGDEILRVGGFQSVSQLHTSSQCLPRLL